LPPSCISCGVVVQKSGKLCNTCWGDITFITDQSCSYCDLPKEFEIDTPSCFLCKNRTPSFSQIKAVCTYGDVSTKLVTNFKFKDRQHLSKYMANAMYKRGQQMLEDVDMILPIPLHFWRFMRRRYNQSNLLASKLASLSGVDYTAKLLKRVKNTKHQTRLKKDGRIKNIANAFKVMDEDTILGKNICLIDDVMTTGATMEEAANTCIKAGAHKVYGLVFARTGL